MTIQQAYDAYLFYGSSYWSDKTKQYYKKNIGYFLRFLSDSGYDLVHTSLAELPTDVLSHYVVYLRAKEKYDNHPIFSDMSVDGAIKSNTIHSYMRAVKAFFNWLYESGHTSFRYTDGLKLPKRDYDQIIVLTNSEVTRIDQVFDLELPLDLRNCCIIHLMLDAGLRRSEIINLKAADILFPSNTIVINRSKGNKSRAVLLCPKLAGLLLQYINVFHPADFLFFSQAMKPVTDSVINAIFRRVVRNTGIERLHPHLLRHTFATSYIMGGGNLEMLRILLGHSDYDTTKIYLHLAAQNQILQTDVYRLDPIFFKPLY